jgi:protein SCO1/2
MASNKTTVWLILVAAVAAAGGLWLGQHGTLGLPGAPQVSAAVLYPQPRPIPEFALTRSDGQPYTRADLDGAWTLLFFGFTHCPDVCPTTLATLRDVGKALPADVASRVRMTFVSVDPERDTPQRAGEYARFFSPAIVAATGDKATLDALTGALGVLYVKVPSEGRPDGAADYTVDHTASILLVDPQGRLRGLFRTPHDPARIAADIEALVED